MGSFDKTISACVHPIRRERLSVNLVLYRFTLSDSGWTTKEETKRNYSFVFE